MTGEHRQQKSRFLYAVDLDARVRRDNPLRLIKERIKFDRVRAEVAPVHGYDGHVSFDPVIVIKLMVLLSFSMT